MKMMKRIPYCLFLAFTLGLTAPAAEGWVTDMDAALTTAKTEGKYLLLNFTWSDWCGWCIKLKDEVFSKPEFKEYAEKELIAVELDFPRRKELPAETQEQNRKLADKYGIRGYPTVLVLSPEGEVVARTGYRPGGADAYVKHLTSIVDTHQK
jgi:thioredoxin-related protein